MNQPVVDSWGSPVDLLEDTSQATSDVCVRSPSAASIQDVVEGSQGDAQQDKAGGAAGADCGIRCTDGQ